MVTFHDGGLAADHWKIYYTPDEIEEIVHHATTTMITSGQHPIHIRIFPQPAAAPTVVMAHGMLGYGIIQARIQLPFFRAGFNVVQFDLPGMGQSGGPRGGCTIQDVFNAWQDAIDFTVRRFGSPLFAMGVAEDGVTCYYVTANRPDIQAISIHTLFEYGDPGGVHWQGSPGLVKLKAMGLAVSSKVRPTYSIPGPKGIPFEAVFAGPGDDAYIEKLKQDPLGMQQSELRMAYSLIKRQRAPVPFEQCRTPVQVIASEANEIWPYEMVAENFSKLGGPKELVTLPGAPQWEANRQFHETYCAHVVKWFRANGAVTAARFDEGAINTPDRDRIQGRLSDDYMETERRRGPSY